MRERERERKREGEDRQSGEKQGRPRKVGDDGGCYWQRGHSSR